MDGPLDFVHKRTESKDWDQKKVGARTQIEKVESKMLMVDSIGTNK